MEMFLFEFQNQLNSFSMLALFGIMASLVGRLSFVLVMIYHIKIMWENKSSA